ncbi:hypothetical protein LB504_011799 [Fusarium proliferatum]|nr:hypothetical protein LB504_011799 [Fusarium proliferatum]
MPPAVKGCNIEYFDVNARHFCTLCTSDLRFNDDVHIDRVTFHDNLSVRLNRDQGANPQARDSVPNRRWLFVNFGLRNRGLDVNIPQMSGAETI